MKNLSKGFVEGIYEEEEPEKTFWAKVKEWFINLLKR